MKDRKFWVIVAIISIQSCYFFIKVSDMEKQLSHLERYGENIDNNVATIDERMVWDIIPKVETLYDKSY
jgi:hypothetical protein